MDKDSLDIRGKLDKGTQISPITFVATVLTFESRRPSLLSKLSYKPGYVHHVVLMPLCLGTIGITSTQPFVLARSLASGSHDALSGSSHVSVTITSCLKWDTYNNEIAFRQKYGITHILNEKLVKQGLVPRATLWSLYKFTDTRYKTDALVCFADDNDIAYAVWEDRLLKDWEDICVRFEPVYID